MSLSPDSTMGESIRGTLTQRAGRAPDTTSALGAITATWQYMAARLEPVIGTRGVGVLLDRALHLTGKKYLWLVQAAPTEPVADPLARLQSRFTNRDSADVAEAGSALLVTFTELLASLIGEPLTERLLASVWLAAPPPSEQDHSHD
ncbi:MAG: hypothetical protein H7172_05345 [Ferruginibacter sp.]|nr:hypothetical protein [Rhodoferax sp.]